MVIKLTHIGERLVKAMAEKDPDAFYERCGLTRPVHGGWEIETELELEPWNGRRFDPVSKVDLGIRMDGSSVVPVEIKLGMKGLGRKSVEKMLRSWDESKHSDLRWKGSMMAILDRRFPELSESKNSPRDLRVRVQGQSFKLTEKWIVIARQKVIASWQREPLFQNARFICFDCWVSNLGKEAFNHIVNPLLAVDFYQEWIERTEP